MTSPVEKRVELAEHRPEQEEELSAPDEGLHAPDKDGSAIAGSGGVDVPGEPDITARPAAAVPPDALVPPDNVHPFPVPEPATLGADLRRAREEAGLSLAELAQRTKIRPGLLASIEADDHDRLPALTYTIGFVKAYARSVGMDPGAAAERYRLESRRVDPVPAIVDIEPLDSRRLPGRPLVAASILAALLVLGLLVAGGLGLFDDRLPAPPDATPTAEVPTSAEVPASAAAPARPELPDPAAAQAEAAAAATGPVRLAAREDVWIRVREGPRGERLFEGTLRKGETLDIPPGRAWRLRAGRAGAVEVSIGGELLPPLGGDGEVLASQSLLPDDLRARTAERPGPYAPARPAR